MNQRSLEECNRLLAAAARRAQVGQVIPGTPAELGEEVGVTDRLAVARAVRALISRGRVEQEGDRYRLLDARPLEPGERATVVRPVRRRKVAAAKAAAEERPTYEGLGRAMVERLIEVSAEASELRAALERARREAEAARREALEATREAGRERQRAAAAVEEAETLRRRLEMTEANLRTVLEAAKARPAQPLGDSDTEAILSVLSRKDAPE